MDDSTVRLGRCRDWQVIYDLLSNDFYDAPICYFPRRLLRASAKWLADSDYVFVFTAQQGDARAGYVFSHLFGPDIWRKFSRSHPLLLPELVYVVLTKRMNRSRKVAADRLAHATPSSSPEGIESLRVPVSEAPFRWSEPDSKTAYIEMVYVAQEQRGRGIASAMIRHATQLLSNLGIAQLEAHIDATNYSSVRAFLKADWAVVETSTKDFKAEFTNSADQ